MSKTIIHPTAIVSPKAELGEGVEIGPYSIIEDDVIIDNNTIIRSNVTIANGARIGKNNRIYANAVIATEPQDLKYNNEKTYVKIGDNNLIREFATINRATSATGETILGSNCMIMTYCHIAHDCVLGDNIIMSNATQIGGHVHVQDWVIFGGVAKIHQFSKVGAHAMVGADVKVVKDVPPYTLVGHTPVQVEGINKIGLRRRGFTKEVILAIDNFYNKVLHSGFNTTDGVKKYLEENPEPIDEVKLCIDFIKESERGIYR